MKAIILAAGVGSRLEEYTKTCPKCLLDIGGESILGRELRLLKELGFAANDILIMGGYKAEMLSGLDARVCLNKEYMSTDNSYTLGLAFEKVDDDVIIMDGDLVFERNILSEILSCMKENVVLSKISNDLSESTGILTDKNGYVLDIGKHIINSGYVYLSILKVSKKTVPDFKNALLDSTKEKSWYTAPLSTILIKHPFFNLTSKCKWHEIDDISDYAAAQEFFGESC